MAEHAENVRDHWYWRPGWAIGRRFYTWHITFSDQPAVVDLARNYESALKAVPVIDPIPPQWLHLTMQGIGFIDEVDRADVTKIVERTSERCRLLRPFNVSLETPHVDPESIQIAIQPPEPVRELRHAIRSAIADIWGPNLVPERAEPYNPHMSLGYTNADAPGQPLRSAIESVPRQAATATIRSCQLIVLHRDNRMYEWENYATVTLGE